MNIDTEIIRLLEKNGRMRRRDLIEELQKQHSSDTGYSKPNLDRRIGQLVRLGKIAIIDAEDFKTYAIDDPDTRATYLIARETVERKSHFDTVIKDLHSENPGEIKTALLEISLYENKLFLDSKQLDSIVSVLGSDQTNTDYALQIIEEAVIKKNVLPSKSKHLTDKLKKVLKVFGGNKENRTIIRRAVHLLGKLGDDAVIDQLKNDAPLFDADKVRIEEYCFPVLIPVIEQNRTRLYEMEKAFMKEGNEQAARSIFRIRQYALSPEKPKTNNPLDAINIPRFPVRKVRVKLFGGKR